MLLTALAAATNRKKTITHQERFCSDTTGDAEETFRIHSLHIWKNQVQTQQVRDRFKRLILATPCTSWKQILLEIRIPTFHLSCQSLCFRNTWLSQNPVVTYFYPKLLSSHIPASLPFSPLSQGSEIHQKPLKDKRCFPSSHLALAWCSTYRQRFFLLNGVLEHAQHATHGRHHLHLMAIRRVSGQNMAHSIDSPTWQQQELLISGNTVRKSNGIFSSKWEHPASSHFHCGRHH